MQFRMDQRPWIGVINIQTQGGRQDINSIACDKAIMTISNTGKTPALKVKIEWGTTWGIRTEIPDYDNAVRRSLEIEKLIFNMDLEQIKKNSGRNQYEIIKRKIIETYRDVHRKKQYDGGAMPPMSNPSPIVLSEKML